MPKAPVRTVYVGIDPGQSGGTARIADGFRAEAYPMPATERDVWEMIQSLQETSFGRAIAIIEKVHAMPKQGVSSTFKFGTGYGGLRMALIAAGIPFDEVTPRTWQKALGVVARKKTETITQFKNRLKAKAQQLFPSVKVTLKTADALLIAEYCRRKEEGKL